MHIAYTLHAVERRRQLQLSSGTTILIIINSSIGIRLTMKTVAGNISSSSVNQKGMPS
jgi:hypothetical protein